MNFPGLRGTLEILGTTYYGQEEKTRNGHSKENWRLLRLQGDEKLMQSLYQFPEDHRFHLGASYVQIKGGNRITPDPDNGRRARKERDSDDRRKTWAGIARGKEREDEEIVSFKAVSEILSQGDND